MPLAERPASAGMATDSTIGKIFLRGCGVQEIRDKIAETGKVAEDGAERSHTWISEPFCKGNGLATGGQGIDDQSQPTQDVLPCCQKKEYYPGGKRSYGHPAGCDRPDKVL